MGRQSSSHGRVAAVQVFDPRLLGFDFFAEMRDLLPCQQ